MSYPMIEIGDLMLKRNGSVDPSKFPDETFELHSIPAFDKGTPDIVKGSEIGSSKQLVQENDVMISKIVPHIRRASVVCPKGDYRQIASGEWIVFRSDKIYPDYLKHVLISDTFNKQFMATVSGVGGSLLRARPAFVAKIKIALPPLAEQRRIASILDQADELRQKRQQAIEKLDQLLQATFIDMFGDPVSNPKGWEVCKLGNLVSIKGGGTPSRNIDEYWNGDIPWVTVKDFKENLFINGAIESITIAGVNNSATNIIPKGTLIMPTRMGLGKIALTIEDVAINQDIKALFIKDNKKISQGFLLYFLLFIKHQIISLGKGATVKGITLEELNAIKTINPSLDLQEKWSKIALSIEDQKQNLYKQLDMQNQFFSSLQNQAFSGTL